MRESTVPAMTRPIVFLSNVFFDARSAMCTFMTANASDLIFEPDKTWANAYCVAAVVVVLRNPLP